MRQVRFAGRGGQGVVTTAELLAVAAFHEGRFAQALPSFGAERTGMPVTASCRIDDHPIRAHDPVARPDVVVVQDRTLLRWAPLAAGLADGGLVLCDGRDVPATELAREHVGRPLPGTALLGALAARTGIVSLDALEAAIAERLPATADGNIAAARAAYAGQVDGARTA